MSAGRRSSERLNRECRDVRRHGIYSRDDLYLPDDLARQLCNSEGILMHYLR